MDHYPLIHLGNLRDTHGHLARWALTFQSYKFVVEHRAGAANSNADGLSWEPWFPIKGKGMSEIKENIDKKTSLTGAAAHLQQELFVKEQSCSKNGYGNVIGCLQVNRTNDCPNDKHVYENNSPDSQDSLSQEAASLQQVS